MHANSATWPMRALWLSPCCRQTECWKHLKLSNHPHCLHMGKVTTAALGLLAMPVCCDWQHLPHEKPHFPAARKFIAGACPPCKRSASHWVRWLARLFCAPENCKTVCAVGIQMPPLCQAALSWIDCLRKRVPPSNGTQPQQTGPEPTCVPHWAAVQRRVQPPCFHAKRLTWVWRGRALQRLMRLHRFHKPQIPKTACSATSKPVAYSS